MDEQPAPKRQRIFSERSLDTELKALVTALKGLSDRVDSIKCRTELPLNLWDVQSLQAQLDKFGKSLDIASNPVSKYKCPKCLKGFRRKDRMFAHCETYHPEREYWKLSCPCPRTFKTLHQRNEHLKSHHMEEYEMERALIEGEEKEEKEEAHMEPRGGVDESTTLQISDNIGVSPLSYARPSSSDAKADTAGEKPKGAIWDFNYILSPWSHNLQNVESHTEPNSSNAADVIRGNSQRGGIWDFQQGWNPETGQSTGEPNSHAQPNSANTKEHTTTTTKENNSL